MSNPQEQAAEHIRTNTQEGQKHENAIFAAYMENIELCRCWVEYFDSFEAMKERLEDTGLGPTDLCEVFYLRNNLDEQLENWDEARVQTHSLNPEA